MPGINDNNPQKPDPTPRRRAETSSSIPTKQKVKLTQEDGGRCLITGDSVGNCVDTCHVLGRKIGENKLKEYERAWGIQPGTFDVDSTHNLIHLQADWRRSYDANHWALVPTSGDLTDIAYQYGLNKKWKYECYQLRKRPFQFVAFPPIYKKPIFRASDLDDEHLDDMDQDDEASAYSCEGDDENIDPDDNEADDMDDDIQEGDYRWIHHSKMSPLQSQIHPYLAIANALPKFTAQRNHLTPKQKIIYHQLQVIEAFWLRRSQPAASGLPGRRGDGGRRGGRGERGSGGRAGRGGAAGHGGPGSMGKGKGGGKSGSKKGSAAGDQNHTPRKTKQTPSKTDKKRKCEPSSDHVDPKAKRSKLAALPTHPDKALHLKRSPAGPPKGFPTPPDSKIRNGGASSCETPQEYFKYDDRDAVVAWIDAVSSAGTPEPVEPTIV